MRRERNDITAGGLQFEVADNFLLFSNTAEKLYLEIKGLPVVDPHNHVDPATLAANKPFENIYQLWIKPDQYKSRAMRQLGVKEKFITGKASDFEKFSAWAESLQQTVGNPIFHWSCMELKDFFGINEILSRQNAERIWNDTNSMLREEQFTPVNILKKAGVELMCTSDDLLDSLQHHIAFKSRHHFFSCLPSLRGDSILAFQQPQFDRWFSKLESLSQVAIDDLASYKAAIIRRLDFFDEVGCLLSDHSLDTGFDFSLVDELTASSLFRSVLHKKPLSGKEAMMLQSHMLHFLGTQYAIRDWKMQLHMGANRYTSSRLREIAGPAGGYASIGTTVNVQALCQFLDSLDVEHRLPKTILYNLNPADNAVFASITGSFSDEGIPGKIQFGPAWWFNDHEQGITQQLITLSSYGLLSTSIGMTTDSRSILSFMRHDYFRRILCNLLATWADQQKIPCDFDFISQLAGNIAYHNIKNWIKKT